MTMATLLMTPWIILYFDDLDVKCGILTLRPLELPSHYAVQMNSSLSLIIGYIYGGSKNCSNVCLFLKDSFESKLMKYWTK